MTANSIAVKVIEVKVEYDHCDPQQVLEVIERFYPDLTVQDYTPELITPFIPEGADAGSLGWLKTLKNADYNRRNPPKKKNRSRSRNGTANPKHNPAEALVTRERLARLMNEPVPNCYGLSRQEVA